MSRACRPAMILLVAATLVAGAACGTQETSTGTSSGGSQPASTAGGGEPGTTGKGPTYTLVPDAEVAAGLAEVRRLAGQVRATLPTDQPGALKLSGEIYEKWFNF